MDTWYTILYITLYYILHYIIYIILYYTIAYILYYINCIILYYMIRLKDIDYKTTNLWVELFYSNTMA